MPYIKELKIHGFKSFARETTIPLRNTMNVIVGPNGSGKSNVTDAICFVLGRLGSKSMRAKRLSNLIFSGTNKYKPSREAVVELVFDNTDKGFSLDNKEVKITRVLRRNGQGIYKINNEVKTRQEILELMAHAGIDPNGFNIVLQGEIDSFVKMPPDKRRNIIEEVAGIRIYEIRKQRSLKELEKTEQKLKEVSATLRERQAYLKNLEQERKQALRYKKLQQDIKDFKMSILQKTINEKQEKLDSINKIIKKHQDTIVNINGLIDKDNHEIDSLNSKINHITNNIQKSSGIEQEKLNVEISDLRADLAGLTITKQSLESSLNENKARREDITENIETFEREIKDLSSKSPASKERLKKELEIKKNKLEELDENKRKFYQLKSSLTSFDSRLEDKNKQIQRTANEKEFILNRIQELESSIKIKENTEHQNTNLLKAKSELTRLRDKRLELEEFINKSEKEVVALEQQIKEVEEIKHNLNSFDICPLCKSKMTKEHISSVISESEEKKKKYADSIKNKEKKIRSYKEEIEKIDKDLEKRQLEIETRKQDILKLDLIQEKKESLRRLTEQNSILEDEKQELEAKKKATEAKMHSFTTTEENYDSLRLEVQELERRQEKDLGMELTLKQRDIERLKNTLRQANREIEEAESEYDEITENLEAKQDLLHEKNEQEEELKRKFKKTLDEKNNHQEKIRFFERDIFNKQTEKHQNEEKINNLKIERAQYLAQKEASEQEANDSEIKGGKVLRIPIEELRKRLQETQIIIASLGTVNFRALELYEDFKKQYEEIEKRANTLLEEKQEILKIIEDIDKKKRKVFLKTLEEINRLFSRNFSQLSTKGIASLEIVDKENIFDSGLEMLIKVGKGKYFDTHSLSGGEQSLISLSLIFAIQEYKPYCFYIFDEIDAALDRRNSERLASLLKRYMKNGQYIIITHNDSLITESPTIYGVSMQDKISQVLSLEV